MINDPKLIQEVIKETNKFYKKKDKTKMLKKYTPITGKCKERLDNGTCLGCNRLELYDFTGDDDCPEFRDEQLEIKEKEENADYYFNEAEKIIKENDSHIPHLD